MVIELESPFTSFAIGASVPIGTRGLVHIKARNDMSTDQWLGIDWIVRDPDGIEIEHHSEWEMEDPGQEHEFIGGRFDINKPGDWTIAIALSMNPNTPEVVDSYSGLLCRITEEYAGTITRKELEYDGVRGNIPVY